MKKAMLASLVALALVGAAAVAFMAEAKSDDEAQIKALEERFVEGVKEKDIDKIMSCFAPDETLFVFDAIPPRQYVGAEAYRKDWEGAIGATAGPMEVEMTDLSITSDGKLAFGHNIQRYISTDKEGKKSEVTLRATDDYKRIKGKWLIVQEHLSVPVDLATGKADLNSKP